MYLQTSRKFFIMSKTLMQLCASAVWVWCRNSLPNANKHLWFLIQVDVLPVNCLHSRLYHNPALEPGVKTDAEYYWNISLRCCYTRDMVYFRQMVHFPARQHTSICECECLWMCNHWDAGETPEFTAPQLAKFKSVNYCTREHCSEGVRHVLLI